MTQKKFSTSVNIEQKSLPDKQPLFDIRHNGKICQSRFDAELGINRLEITLKNKNPNDTKVDLDGKILADLALQITGLVSDGHDLTSHFQTHCVYVTEGGVIEKTYGFLHKNGTVSFEWTCPPFLYLRNLALTKT